MLAYCFGKAISEILCGFDGLSPGYGYHYFPCQITQRFGSSSAENISVRYRLLLYFGWKQINNVFFFSPKKLSLNWYFLTLVFIAALLCGQSHFQGHSQVWIWKCGSHKTFLLVHLQFNPVSLFSISTSNIIQGHKVYKKLKGCIWA